MPDSKSTESGQLIVFPKIRKEPTSELSNILGKLKYFSCINEKGFKNLLKTKKFVEFDFKTTPNREMFGWSSQIPLLHGWCIWLTPRYTLRPFGNLILKKLINLTFKHPS